MLPSSAMEHVSCLTQPAGHFALHRRKVNWQPQSSHAPRALACSEHRKLRRRQAHLHVRAEAGAGVVLPAGVSSTRTSKARQDPPTGGRAFFDWFIDLPWKRVGVWGLVGVFGYQLKDFFGVRPTGILRAVVAQAPLSTTMTHVSNCEGSLGALGRAPCPKWGPRLAKLMHMNTLSALTSGEANSSGKCSTMLMVLCAVDCNGHLCDLLQQQQLCRERGAYNGT